MGLVLAARCCTCQLIRPNTVLNTQRGSPTRKNEVIGGLRQSGLFIDWQRLGG
jgi:hypothetical protein